MKLKITVQGVAYEVEVEIMDGQTAASSPVPLYVAPIVQSAPPVYSPAPRPPAPKTKTDEDTNGIISPVAGTVTDVKCRAGDAVKRGQTLLLVEAMKMETAIVADKDAVIKKVAVNAGDAIREGQLLLEYE